MLLKARLFLTLSDRVSDGPDSGPSLPVSTPGPGHWVGSAGWGWARAGTRDRGVLRAQLAACGVGSALQGRWAGSPGEGWSGELGWAAARGPARCRGQGRSAEGAHAGAGAGRGKQGRRRPRGLRPPAPAPHAHGALLPQGPGCQAAQRRCRGRFGPLEGWLLAQLLAQCLGTRSPSPGLRPAGPPTLRRPGAPATHGQRESLTQGGAGPGWQGPGGRPATRPPRAPLSTVSCVACLHVPFPALGPPASSWGPAYLVETRSRAGEKPLEVL